MAVKTNKSRRKAKSNARKRLNLQKPNGVIGPRVAKVGGARFAIVCVDPAKHRSEWMMADYFGNLLIEHRRTQGQLPVCQRSSGIPLEWGTAGWPARRLKYLDSQLPEFSVF